MTARQAMQVVAGHGLIERKRGAGTFVRSTTVPRDLGSPLSFSGSMEARGMTASSETLQFGEMVPSDDETRALDLDGGTTVTILERLRLADEVPMAIERVAMRNELAASLAAGFENGSLHDAFRAIGRRPTESHAEVSARRASARQRRLLHLPQSGIVMAELRTIVDQFGQPLERTETCYAADRYVFRAVLREGQERA